MNTFPDFYDASSQWRLVDDSGKHYKVGDTVRSFRGEDATIEQGYPPRAGGSSGHVKTTIGYHFTTVYGLRWERVTP